VTPAQSAPVGELDHVAAVGVVPDDGINWSATPSDVPVVVSVAVSTVNPCALLTEGVVVL
jgi:hypothetical protein